MPGALPGALPLPAALLGALPVHAAVLLLEPVHQGEVPVVAADARVARGRDDLDDAAANVDNCSTMGPCSDA